MAEYCDLNKWQSQSMIISAVSDAPDGPFNQQRAPVLGPWSHNAMISQHPNGTYFLFHIGTGAPIQKSSSCNPGHVDPVYPFPAGHPEPAAATTHASDSLYGPWRAAPNVPGVNNPAGGKPKKKHAIATALTARGRRWLCTILRAWAWHLACLVHTLTMVFSRLQSVGTALC